MGLLEKFQDLALVKDGMRKRMNDLLKNIENINFDDFDKKVQEKVNNLAKQFKEATDVFIIKIPFDKNNQSLSYKIDDDTITITTESCKSTNTESVVDYTESTTVTNTVIPKRFDATRMVQKYDSKNKRMLFIFYKPLIKVKQETKKQVSTNSASNESKENLTKNNEKERLMEYILEKYKTGYSYRKLAKVVGVSDKTIKRWIEAYTKK